METPSPSAAFRPTVRARSGPSSDHFPRRIAGGLLVPPAGTPVAFR